MSQSRRDCPTTFIMESRECELCLCSRSERIVSTGQNTVNYVYTIEQSEIYLQIRTE
jgi:hypothetical protein